MDRGLSSASRFVVVDVVVVVIVVVDVIVVVAVVVVVVVNLANVFVAQCTS